MQVQSMPNVSANQTPGFQSSRQNVPVLQGNHPRLVPLILRQTLVLHHEPGRVGNLRGDMIYVPNGDGTLREAAPSRGVKRLRNTSARS